MSKKVYLTIAILTILLYILIALQQIYVMEIGEIFGYLFWAVIAAGIIGAIWLLLKRPKKESA
jgi:membrane protein DedA with SNARE-associated domain